LTADKFVPSPFSREPGARLYRTGDVARYLPDGNVEFLGRTDHQVKIRGYRIELDEIQSVLFEHALVRDAVVTAIEGAPGDSYLSAYIVSSQQPPPEPEQLRAFLREKLPDYMVPSAFTFLDALPLSPNGKVDRQALPRPDPRTAAERPPYEAPSTAVEEIIAEIWSEVLGIERIGVRDNFFELGGHSLLVTQVLSRIRAIFEIDVPVELLVDSPTVASLAECVEHALSGEESFAGPGQM
jgi:hypothetical protein